MPLPQCIEDGPAYQRREENASRARSPPRCTRLLSRLERRTGQMPAGLPPHPCMTQPTTPEAAAPVPRYELRDAHFARASAACGSLRRRVPLNTGALHESPAGREALHPGHLSKNSADHFAAERALWAEPKGRRKGYFHERCYKHRARPFACPAGREALRLWRNYLGVRAQLRVALC